MNVKSKLIFNQYVARQLLVKYGHQIIDLKKDKHRENATIFVFSYSDKLLHDLNAITSSPK